MAKDYLQLALGKFNVGIHQWYGWKDLNAPMNYSNIKLNDDTATMPTEAEVNAKIQELKDAEQNAINKKASGKQKLKDLGLDDDEINALMGA